MRINARRWTPRRDRFDARPIKPGPRARSGRLPRTLGAASGFIVGYSRAMIEEDLQAVSAAIHFLRPCYAQLLQRIARQAGADLSATDAIAAWPETPDGYDPITTPGVTTGPITTPALAITGYTNPRF